MKKIASFIIKLILFSILAVPTVSLFEVGYRGILQLSAPAGTEISFVGARMLYVFFVLLLATSGVGVLRTSVGILSAISLYLCIDRLMIPLWRILPYTNVPLYPVNKFYLQVYFTVMHWILPFILWFGFGRRGIEGMLGRSKVGTP